MGQPMYEHDCDICTYLGAHENMDLYVHTGPKFYGTYIARNSSQDSDYESGKVFVGIIPGITEAHKRASERGMGLDL